MKTRFLRVSRPTAFVLAISALSIGSASVTLNATAAESPAAMAKTGTQYKADADMQSVLDELAVLGGKPIESLTPEEARQQPTPTDAVMAVLKKKGKDTSPTALVPGVVSVDRDIPGAAGNLPARVYTPDGSGPFPVVVYFHGGGWVIADKQVYDGGARALSKQAKAIVVSVDYRRAPEAKFPAAWDDALAAYKWVAANAASINGDPAHLAIAGESAGGNLAIATAVAVRDAGVQKPTHVLAVYPVAQTGDMNTASYVDSATAKPLNKAMIGWFVDKLLAKPADATDPRLDVVHADLKGLPPVTIINAQIDPLREDGTLLQAALKKAGVKVDRLVYSGVTHEFFGMGAVVSKAADAEKLGGRRCTNPFPTDSNPACRPALSAASRPCPSRASDDDRISPRRQRHRGSDAALSGTSVSRPRKIRVNAVLPGPVWTPNIPGTMPIDEVEKFGHEVAMARPGQPEELAPAYVLLASSDGSFMTGSLVEVTGGKMSGE